MTANSIEESKALTLDFNKLAKMVLPLTTVDNSDFSPILFTLTLV
jgi:hypothetical protein